MKIAITGANGLFGCGLVRVIGARHNVYPMTRAVADLTDIGAVRSALLLEKPDVLIHTAGIPDPDLCESEPERAFSNNVLATRNVVAVAQELSFPVAHISTDAVFDGAANSPRVETDAVGPISVYGKTKLLAEQEVAVLNRYWIFRISVLFGPGKDNFVDKGFRTLRQGTTYTVASDQEGSATYTLDAASKILKVIESKRYGLFHLCNQGACTRLELARFAAELANLPAENVIGKPMAEMKRKAPRPKYSVMQMKALANAGILLPRHWKEALAEYVARLDLKKL
ncbi:MAG TPA: NAD(P)-dependent oxidoreductase [Candidatus Angelobacter sp.]|jgi:dTDP-4-dehydrorhamnose reductase